MPIVTTSYRPKRAPRKKRKQPPIANRIVTPAPLKPIKGPVIRLREQHQANDNAQERPSEPSYIDYKMADDHEPKRPAIVEPKRKPQPSVFGPAPDLDPEEHQRCSEAARELWRELVRRATAPESGDH